MTFKFVRFHKFNIYEIYFEFLNVMFFMPIHVCVYTCTFTRLVTGAVHYRRHTEMNNLRSSQRSG